MKRSRMMGISRYPIRVALLVFLVSMTGCGNRAKLLDARLDVVDDRLDALSEGLDAYGTASRKRSDGHAGAIRQLEDRLTTRFDEKIWVYDVAGKKRSANHTAAVSQLEGRLTAQFDEKIKANDAAAKERSAGHAAAIRQLENSVADQQQELDRSNADLKKHLDAIAAALENGRERDDKAQAALAATASKKELARLIRDVSTRYAGAQRLLEEVTDSSANAVQISTEVRTVMQRLIEAHEFYIKGSTKLIAELDTKEAQGESNGSESVRLGILSEQRKAQKRLLKEVQNLLLNATRDVPATPPDTAASKEPKKDKEPKK